MTPPAYYVGLISGTSIDGVDAGLVRVDGDGIHLETALGLPYPDDLARELRALCQPGDNEIERLGPVDNGVAATFADAVAELLAQSGHRATDIRAIGSHGQTLRHRPEGTSPFTLQVGNPSAIAERTGITTVADFRRRDMAAGGQGAPLASAFHAAVFSDPSEARAVVNIGGIANVTLLVPGEPVRGFDTGPGNTLMDAWIREHRGEGFDADGSWAATGFVDPVLLDALLADPYFSLTGPRSTGPETFNLGWVNNHLLTDPAPEAVQRTLLELSALTIVRGLAGTGVARVVVCGGGVHNALLMAQLARLLAPVPVVPSATLGIDPDWVEAATFAWLAHRTLEGLPGNAPSVTGASGERILGAVYAA